MSPEQRFNNFRYVNKRGINIFSYFSQMSQLFKRNELVLSKSVAFLRPKTD